LERVSSDGLRASREKGIYEGGRKRKTYREFSRGVTTSRPKKNSSEGYRVWPWTLKA